MAAGYFSVKISNGKKCAMIPSYPYSPHCPRTGESLLPSGTREKHNGLWAVYLFENGSRPVKGKYLKNHLVISIQGQQGAFDIANEFVHNQTLKGADYGV